MRTKSKGGRSGLIVAAALLAVAAGSVFWFASKADDHLPAPSEQRLEVTNVL